jgi:hypothetical protein
MGRVSAAAATPTALAAAAALLLVIRQRPLAQVAGATGFGGGQGRRWAGRRVVRAGHVNS